jgi:hypothetical protein
MKGGLQNNGKTYSDGMEKSKKQDNYRLCYGFKHIAYDLEKVGDTAKLNTNRQGGRVLSVSWSR